MRTRIDILGSARNIISVLGYLLRFVRLMLMPKAVLVAKLLAAESQLSVCLDASCLKRRSRNSRLGSRLRNLVRDFAPLKPRIRRRMPERHGNSSPGISVPRDVEDGDLDPDNNEAERAIRPVAIGRKNWTFCGSDNGGRTAAVLISICSTCRSLGVNPWAYIRDVLIRVSIDPASQIRELLPDRWQLRTAAETPAVS